MQSYGFALKEEQILEFSPTELQYACKALYPHQSCELKNAVAFDYIHSACSGKIDMIEQLILSTKSTTTTATTDTTNSLLPDVTEENKGNEVQEIILWVLYKRMNEMKRINSALKDYTFEEDEIKFENMIIARLPLLTVVKNIECLDVQMSRCSDV